MVFHYRDTVPRVWSLCWILLIISGSISVSQAQFQEVTSPPEEWKKGFESITDEQGERWLHVLAGPKFKGRGTGQPGFAMAAHWVAGKLAEFGLTPAGDNGTYFQMLPMKNRVPMLEECFLEGPDGLRIGAVGQIGFERYTDQQETVGDLAIVRFSGAEPQLPTDVDLRDKIVIYTADDDASRSAAFRLARTRPAAAIRVIAGVPNSISQLVREGRRSRSTSVSGTITQQAARQLLSACEVAENWLDLPANKEAVADVLIPGKRVTLRLRFREEQAAVPNVVALLEGSDPEARHEYVVVGSHLDHLGIRGGQVYPGADDNASGSTAVLSIAKALSVNPLKPKRSILFIWFAAEEIGLIGSGHYTQNPILPTDGMICMFNIDMVGRDEENDEETAEENKNSIHLIGSERGDPALHELVLRANQHVGFAFEFDEERVWNRSDQVHFYRLGVPVAFLFDGFHPDYHRPSDVPSKINFEKLAAAAKLYYLAAIFAAEHGRFSPNSAKADSR